MTDLSDLEQAYLKKDLGEFVRILQTMKSNNDIDVEADDPKYQIFKKGTPLTTMVAISPFDSAAIPYVQALLESNTDPNHINHTLGGLTVLENLKKNAEPNFNLADDTLQKNLNDLINLLISYGADTIPYEDKSDSETAKTINKILLDYASEIDATTDLMGLHDRLCKDLSKENNLRQLKMLAKGLGITVSGKKADICSDISQFILYKS